MKINLPSKDYCTQNNNTIKPGVACMPTTRVMFYKGNGFEFNCPKVFSQPEDWFMELLNSKEAKRFAAKKYPDLAGKFPPNQIHGMYSSYLDPLVIGKRVSDFSLNLTPSDFKKYIDNGKVIMTSGHFEFPTGKVIDGHAFCVIGYDAHSFIIADPHGDYTTEYKSNKGYCVHMSFADFERITKPIGSKKWGHIPL